MLARELVVNELAGENRADTAEGAVCFLCGMKSFFAILVFGSVAESEFPGSVHELLVRELVVEHRADNAEGVGCLGVECAEARGHRRKRKEAQLSEHRCIVCSGCLCCLVSLKSRPNPGLLVLGILAGNGSLAPMQISPLFLFKKNTRGPTNAQHRMLYRHAAALTQLCPVLQSGRKCSSCASPPRIWPSWTQAGRDVI